MCCTSDRKLFSNTLRNKEVRVEKDECSKIRYYIYCGSRCHCLRGGVKFASHTDDPKIILPPRLYGLVGQELNIYFDNIVDNRDSEYDFEVISYADGQHLENCYRIFPAEAGWYEITINIYRHGEKIGSAESTLIVSDPNAGNNISRSLLVIGDSTTANGICMSKLISNFDTDVMDITLLGTKGAAPNLHEGISGWTIDMYYSMEEFDGTANAFFNPDTQVFDFGYYMIKQGYSDLDYVIFNLGINDVFSVSDETDLRNTVDNMLSQYGQMIKSIKAFDDNIKIGLAITIPPAYSQDAFGLNHGTDYVRWRYKRHNYLWCKSLINEFKDQEENDIYLVPIHVNLDTKYNMGMEQVQVNARNPQMVEVIPANGSVHPNEYGYWQIADVYWYFLKSFEK